MYTSEGRSFQFCVRYRVSVRGAGLPGNLSLHLQERGGGEGEGWDGKAYIKARTKLSRATWNN